MFRTRSYYYPQWYATTQSFSIWTRYYQRFSRPKHKRVNLWGDCSFGQSFFFNGKLTLRSESRGSLLTMPSREEEKPAKQG